jgi:hypothetical protein
VRQYRFPARVTLDTAGREGPAQGLTSRMRALTAHDCCLLQPFCYRVYLPAVISPDRELPLQPGGRVVVTIALAGGEAEALFPPDSASPYGLTPWSTARYGPRAWSATVLSAVGRHRHCSAMTATGFAARPPAWPVYIVWRQAKR